MFDDSGKRFSVTRKGFWSIILFEIVVHSLTSHVTTNDLKGLEFNLSTELGRENGETKLINEKSKFLQEKQQFPGRVVSKAREMTNLSTRGNREIKI